MVGRILKRVRMRQPLWIVNSSLVTIACIAGAVFFAMKQTIPPVLSLRVSALEKSAEKPVKSINIAKIYQNDLFGTYIPQDAAPVKDEFEIPPMPTLPMEIMPRVPVPTSPTFIEPLNVLLKGVIYINDDALNSIAIVQDSASKAEYNYRIGDFIEDAQLLKIFPHSVIVLRSNGQQETLYLRDEDAMQDINLEVNINADQVIFAKSAQPGVYQIYVPAFTDKIPSVGQFIDALDLTTVYKQGKPVGLRVGKIQQVSLAQQLGLQTEDMIETINDISVDSIDNRMKAFEIVSELPMGSTVTVTLQRSQQPLSLQYILMSELPLNDAAQKEATSTDFASSAFSDQAKQNLEDKRKQVLQQRYKFAPTLQQIETSERMNMLKNKKNGVSTHMPQNIKDKQAKSS